MHLNKRLSLRHAAYIMVAGWAFALITASMPLIGVSDYRKFAICLPFETGKKLQVFFLADQINYCRLVQDFFYKGKFPSFLQIFRIRNNTPKGNF
jgi:hypothetical protein